MKQISTTTIFLAITVIGILMIILLASSNNATVSDKLSLPLKIQEYFDYGCPHCQDLEPTVAKLRSDFPDDLQVEYIYYNIFPQSLDAAYAAAAAREQNKFLDYHDALYSAMEKQKATSGEIDFTKLDYSKLASDLKLDVDKFNKDRADSKIQAQVQSLSDKSASKVPQGTPTVYVNGVLLQLETAGNGRDFTPTYNKIKGIIETLKQK